MISVAGHTGFFLKFSFAISAVMLILQVAFQVVLISMGNYGNLIRGNCEYFWLLVNSMIQQRSAFELEKASANNVSHVQL